MRNHRVFRPIRGFSLIEVLVAVVILSVGLLALASLQMSLIRSSAGAKAQSVAMALAKQRLELLLSFQATGGSDNSCISPAAGTTNTCYRAITTVTDTPTVGGVQYTRTATVTRYVYDKSTGSAGFKSVGNTALDSTLLTSPVTYLPGKEYKKIAMTVTWTDASNAANTVMAEGAIGAINPADSATLSKSGKGVAPRKAQAIITNPASVAGVIPIAIGNGSDTAATNPRPIIVSQGNSSTSVETRFDIYTYIGLDSSTAVVQSKVETAVVGCKCTSTNQTHSANRPSYWDGFQYTIPTTAANIPVSAPVTGNSVTQSALCTICCRDHFDPVGVTGEKFDPRRTTHNHYLASDLNTVVSAGTYNESCRLIRVDGFFRVATEPYDDHYGLLGTVGLMNSTATTTVVNAVPSTGTGSISALYQAYVLNYLKARFVDITTYNTPLDPSIVTGYSAIQVPTPNALINQSTSPQYLHSRGLVIDYLSPETIAAVAQAKASCIVTNCTAAELQTAVLKLLPFTSINATELAKWTTTNSNKIGVSLLQDFAESINQSLPVSGRATYNSGANPDAITAGTTIQGGSAGLALSPDIFPATAYTNSFYSKSDTQPFVIGSGAVVGPYPGGEAFSIGLTGADFLANVLSGNPAQVYFGSSTKSCTPNATTMTPYECVTDTNLTLGGSTAIKVGNYNRSGNKSVQNSCSRTSNNPDNDVTDMPYAIVFDVSSATVDGVNVTPFSVTNNNIPGINGEYTTMTANPVNINSTVTINFSAKSYMCPSNWSTFLTNTGDDGNTNPSNSNCTTGNLKSPIWNTASYVACWSGFAP